jgi:hypothetical protein
VVQGGADHHDFNYIGMEKFISRNNTTINAIITTALRAVFFKGV